VARIYVTRDEAVTVVSRRRPPVFPGRRVRRSWRELVEYSARSRTSGTTLLTFGPPAALGGVVAILAPPEIAVAVGGASLVATTYVAPTVRRRLSAWVTARRVKAPRLRRSSYAPLRGAAEQEAFDRAIGLADRISQTWPRLGALIDPADAGMLLAGALWEIAELLARRQELEAVVAGLDRPEFIAEPAHDARPPKAKPGTGAAAEAAPAAAAAARQQRGTANPLVRELRSRLAEAKAALAAVNADLVRRESALHRAEQAGLDFIREQEMRRAIRTADNALRAAPPPGTLDAAADLADRTRAVVAAYRELTAGPL
jgi:hypothetical protein